jgi:hypothetical protein
LCAWATGSLFVLVVTEGYLWYITQQEGINLYWTLCCIADAACIVDKFVIVLSLSLQNVMHTHCL